MSRVILRRRVAYVELRKLGLCCHMWGGTWRCGPESIFDVIGRSVLTITTNTKQYAAEHWVSMVTVKLYNRRAKTAYVLYWYSLERSTIYPPETDVGRPSISISSYPESNNQIGGHYYIFLWGRGGAGGMGERMGGGDYLYWSKWW